MPEFPKGLGAKLEARIGQHALRKLTEPPGLVDFSSNDYLGFATCQEISDRAQTYLTAPKNGSTGSRLISGNHQLYGEAEQMIAAFHNAPSALIFNSGYDANLGIFSSVPQRGDIVLFDEYCHASIRDGLRLSQAKAFKFAHNDLDNLERLLGAHSGQTLFVVTESVFSMDGDSPPLTRLVEICGKHGAFLIVDEAHALGVFGKHGEGLVQEFGLEQRVFARVVTFGKAMGCHGAAVLGPQVLRDYLINFARSLIYTTALPPHSVATIIAAYTHLMGASSQLEMLRDNILHFSREQSRLSLSPMFVGGKSAIASVIIPGNETVRSIAENLREQGFDVRAILSPTVPQGQERLRFCIHSYNTSAQITAVLEELAKNIFS